MRYFAVILCLLLVPAVPASACAKRRPKPTPPPPAPTLSWSSEFNEPAGTFPANWWSQNSGHGWGNNELQFFRPENSATDGQGNLAITAKRENYGGNQYTSGRIESARSLTYGRAVVRAKVPKGRGLWSVLWLWGNNYEQVGWPANGEIDILEVLGHDVFTGYGTAHDPAGAHGGSFNGVDLSAGFHEYGMIWRTTSLTWTFDGWPYYTLNKGTGWVYDHSFRPVLSLAVGGNWPGSPDLTTPFPSKLLVDWVRISPL